MMREPLEIALTRQALNQEEGLKLSSAWLTLYEKLNRREVIDREDGEGLSTGACVQIGTRNEVV